MSQIVEDLICEVETGPRWRGECGFHFKHQIYMLNQAWRIKPLWKRNYKSSQGTYHDLVKELYTGSSLQTACT